MTRILLTLGLIILLSCTDNKEKDQIIKPKWTVGDFRFFNEKGTLFVRTDSDTIVNTNYEKTLKITVLEKDDKGYIVEIALQPLDNLELKTTVDSLSQLSKKLNSALSIVKDLTKYNVPYKIRVSEYGEPIDVVDFDSYLKKYLDTFFGIRDTMNINKEDKETLKQLIQSDSPISGELQMAMGKESTELLSIYNIKDPINGDIIEETTMADPKTGEELPTTLTYHSKSVKGDIHEIELKTEFGESLNDLLTDSTKNETTNKFKYKDMVNSTIYYFNTKTGWLESSNVKVDYQSDKFEMKLRTDIKVYR
jgi:hypothetical protein